MTEHWVATKRLLRYLCGTLDHNISVRRTSSLGLHEFSNAWACKKDDFTSTSAYVVYLGHNRPSLVPLLKLSIALYNVELMFAASFDSKMGCLYSIFDAKKQGKPAWVVRTKNWKLREGENRLSGLLEGVLMSGNYDFRVYGSVNKQWGGVVYRSRIFGFDSGIPRVTISGRFYDWTGSRGLHIAIYFP
ncbi:hypothetical protein GQ457_05G025710 [Hibiscus cannabinus]